MARHRHHRSLKVFTSAWDDAPRAEMAREQPVSKYRAKQPVGAVGAALRDAFAAKSQEVMR